MGWSGRLVLHKKFSLRSVIFLLLNVRVGRVDPTTGPPLQPLDLAREGSSTPLSYHKDFAASELGRVTKRPSPQHARTFFFLLLWRNNFFANIRGIMLFTSIIQCLYLDISEVLKSSFQDDFYLFFFHAA